MQHGGNRDTLGDKGARLSSSVRNMWKAQARCLGKSIAVLCHSQLLVTALYSITRFLLTSEEVISTNQLFLCSYFKGNSMHSSFLLRLFATY